jgi:hypothetical protein
LLGDITRAFCMNVLTLHDYVNNCLAALDGNISGRPVCYLRIDIAHLIKLVGKWTCWKGKRKNKLREFYVRCTRLLIKSDYLFEFKSVLVDILTVLL